MRLLSFAAGLGAVFATAIGTLSADAASTYEVVDLGTLPDCDVTYAEAVNNRGWVVGFAYTHVPPGHGNHLLSRPFLWRDGRMIELSRLGGQWGKAFDINDQGDVVGYAEDKKGSDIPVIWRASANYRPAPLGSDWLQVTAILNDGSIAGTLSDGETRHPVVLRSGKRLMQATEPNSGIRVNAFNSTGALVGFVIPDGGQEESFRSPGDRKAASWVNGREVRFKDFGKGLSECADINEKGIAVGWADSKQGRRACVWSDNTVQVLPSDDEGSAEAAAINDHGVIVGVATREEEDKSYQFAAMWRDRKFYDLNHRLTAPKGWNLHDSADISDTGFVCGYGNLNKFPTHYWRAFLLRPSRRR